jgi:hypothetical protein
MGRTVRTTATTRAVITDRLPSTLTTVYTNNTGRGAELAAVNINGVGDVTNFTTSTGGTQWTHFGSSINPLIQAASASGTGFGHPYSVQLNDNRVLIFFLPHWQHRGGDGQDYFDGDKVHCQILEYQTNKYVAGPITTVLLPTAPFVDTSFSLWSRPNGMSSSHGGNCWKAVALTENKVVVAYRVRNMFRLVRFTITGNTVDHATANLDLTSASFFNNTANGAFAIDTVPGNTNKVVVGGDATSNYSIQAYNIPDTGVLTSATTLTNTGIPRTLFHFGMSRMVQTATANVTPYIIAGATSATASTAVIFNFNSATDTFTVSGLTVSLPAVSSEFSGLECACLSNGTNVNAVIALTGTGAGQTITFCRQTSGAGATNTSTTLTLQHTTTKSINEHYQWGNERAVFIGDAGLLVVYDSAGTATNLLPPTETINTERYQQQWIPFNIRPLYNLSDNAQVFTERNHQWMARTALGTATSTAVTTGTSVGVTTVLGNYFPFGHDYGIGYAWNEQANCWIIGQNGRIYAVDVSGVVQSEITIFNLSPTLNWEYAVRQVGCTPSGRILFVCEYRNGVWGGGSQNVWNTWNNFSATMFANTTEPLLTATGLTRISLENGPSNISMRQSMNLVTFIEANASRTERAVLFSMDSSSSPQGNFHQWTAGVGWANLGNTSISSTTGSNSWFRGFRPNFRLIQDTPASTSFPRGLWRIIGSFAMNSSANYRQGGFSNSADINSPGSFATNSNQFDNTQTNTYGYAVGYSGYNSGSRASVQVVTMYDQTRGVNRIWSSINGRMSLTRGYFPTALNVDTARRYVQPIATKFGYSTSYQNTDIVAGTGIALIWDTVNPEIPRFTLTTTSGNGQIQVFATGKISWQHFGGGVDTTYTVGGIPDDVKFFIVLDNNAGGTFALNNGQSLSILTLESGLFRSEDIYAIPAGSSIRVRADTPRSISTLLTIRENL